MTAHQNFRPLETKSAAPPADSGDVQKAVEAVMKGFEEYKAANDARLKQVETKGAADPVTVEKLAKLDAHLNQFEGVSARLAEAEKKSAELKALEKRFDAVETAMRRAGAPVHESKGSRVEPWARAVAAAHTTGLVNLAEGERKALTDIAAEYKALNVTTDTAGGYLAPREYVYEIIKGETEISPVRSLARVRTTANKSLEIPKRTGQFAAQWVAEQGTRAETTGLTYGKEEIAAHEFYALIDISNQMLEDSAFSMEQEISSEAVEQFALAEGKAFVSGTGTGQPQGFLAAGAGVATTNSGAATAVTADGLLTLKHTVKTAYTRNANFLLNRTTLGSVRKLKDSTGQYLWMPGIAQGKPNSIDGDPYVEMADMPNEAAGAKAVAYGDFRRAYTWVDRISMELLRDPFTQAALGNVRFQLRKRVGGKVVLPEAIRTLTCAAA